MLDLATVKVDANISCDGLTSSGYTNNETVRIRARVRRGLICDKQTFEL